MTRLRVLSDLHFEFHNDHGRAFVKALPFDCDAVIVAGDIATNACLVEALGYLCERFPLVAYVHGNHEDFRVIRGFTKWVYEEHQDAVHYLRAYVQPGDVVVTHHLPHLASVAPRWRGSSLNAFFVSDQSAIIADCKPALWVHGHTHDACDYSIGETRVVCNPYGYHNIEATRSDPAFTVDVEAAK